MVIRLSQLRTEGSGNPCSGPTWTSDLIPRTVRVIGTQVTESRTEAAAFRVTTQTGRRSGGKTGGRLNQRGIRGQAPVRGYEFPVGIC